MADYDTPRKYIITTIRFVWVDKILHVREYRGLLSRHHYENYETFFKAVASHVGFAEEWERFQVIVDNGWGVDKTVYDRNNKGPVILPEYCDALVTIFNRTILIPIHLRLGGEWKPTSSEMWLIPLDAETTLRALKEYLLTGDFVFGPTSLLHPMRNESRRNFTRAQLNQALNQNSMLSTFSISVEYEGEEAEYPENNKLAFNLFGLSPMNRRSPKIVFGVIPVSLWD
jgi:hypothetical protein